MQLNSDSMRDFLSNFTNFDEINSKVNKENFVMFLGSYEWNAQSYTYDIFFVDLHLFTLRSVNDVKEQRSRDEINAIVSSIKFIGEFAA